MHSKVGDPQNNVSRWNFIRTISEKKYKVSLTHNEVVSDGRTCDSVEVVWQVRQEGVDQQYPNGVHGYIRKTGEESKVRK